MISTNLKRIVDFAAKSRLPSIYQSSEFADAGGLVTYGPDRADKPSGLSVERPTKLELVVNLKTAKALGTIPQSPCFAPIG